jgi:hypothetical protein
LLATASASSQILFGRVSDLERGQTFTLTPSFTETALTASERIDAELRKAAEEAQRESNSRRLPRDGGRGR